MMTCFVLKVDLGICLLVSHLLGRFMGFCYAVGECVWHWLWYSWLGVHGGQHSSGKLVAAQSQASASIWLCRVCGCSSSVLLWWSLTRYVLPCDCGSTILCSLQLAENWLRSHLELSRPCVSLFWSWQGEGLSVHEHAWCRPHWQENQHSHQATTICSQQPGFQTWK